jgi:hypothetical protein
MSDLIAVGYPAHRRQGHGAARSLTARAASVSVPFELWAS